MPKKPTTTDDLARLISKGFDEVKSELSDVEERIRKDMATKDDLATMNDRMIEGVAFLMAKHVPRLVDLADIEKRLERLEKQTGIRE